MEKTYIGWQDPRFPKSAQREYTEPTKMFDDDGRVLAAGWARRNVFQYDRLRVKPVAHRKEWDFYQLSNGRYMVQITFCNITLGGYTSALLVDLKDRTILASELAPYAGGANKYVLPSRGDVPNHVKYTVAGATFEADTDEDRRTLSFHGADMVCDFTMDIPSGLENITTLLPFKGLPYSYFLTTKQNCLPCGGTVRVDDRTFEFSKADTFCVLDWGRVCTPYKMLWYWGNGSTRLTGADGSEHLFGFELTWGIGDESNATETCLFYDGKAHKIGAVDVETFPKPDKYMEPWHFISEDGRFDMMMKPFYDHHSDLNVGVMRMHSHQVHGLWSGTATLDDGTVLTIQDMYAFCEYVENRW